mgnify:CR=1 FL=1
MSYTSSTYLFFLAAVFFVYYIIRPKYRMYVLLVANILFYLAAGWDQFLVLLLAAAVSYAAANKMGDLHAAFKEKKKQGDLDRKQIKQLKEENKQQRKRILIRGLILNIGILIVFKYTNFLLGSAYSILDLLGIGHGTQLFRLIMPLGISFFTFQILSYMIDVYKGKVEPQRNFLKYLLYISFFPSVVQGPIPRYADLGTQLYEEHKFEYDNLRDGCILILWGFAKKLILAERLGTFVEQIYGNYTMYTGVIFLVATAAFSIQIYADFSGCMDIASGTARLFGIRLAPNFLRPYFSKTMPEFWRRWHVTLGNWFKDYVFYPISISKFSLDLNKKARKRFGNEVGRIVSSSIPILAVWLLTGIWHGASWNFVFWGLYYGILLLIEKFVLGKYLKKLPGVFQHIYCMFFVMLGWNLFVFDDMSAGISFARALFGTYGAGFCSRETLYLLYNNAVLMVLLILGSTQLPARAGNWICAKLRGKETILTIVKNVFYVGIFLLSVAWLVDASYNPFLYFRF